MAYLDRLRRLFRGSADRGSDGLEENARRLGELAENLDEFRGDRVTPAAPDASSSTMDNVAAATKDYGLSRFSGETDAIGDAAKGYRSSQGDS